MTKEKLKNCYRSLKDAAMSDWHLGDALDNHIKTGYNIVKIDHDSAVSAGLPLDICSREHYIVGHLFVSESGTDDKLQRGRTIGQVLFVNSCNSLTTDIFRRQGNYYNGSCHWNTWARVTDVEGGGTEFISRLQGTDLSSNASRDPFKFLGEFSDANEADLHTALNSLHSTNKTDAYEGVWRFTVAGKPSVLYNFAISYPKDQWLQGLVTVYYPSGNSGNPFSINNKINILSRTYKNGTWSAWECVTGEDAGVMSFEDKKNLLDLSTLLNTMPIERGGIDVNGVFTNSNTRVRTATFLRTPFSYSLKEGYSVVYVLKYDFSGGFVSSSQSPKENYEKDDFLYRISFKKNDGSTFEEYETPIKTYTGPTLLSIEQCSQGIDSCYERVINETGQGLSLINGTIDYSSGKYDSYNAIKRAVTEYFLRAPMSVRTNDEYQLIRAVKYDKEGNFVGSITLGTKSFNLDSEDDLLYKFTFKRDDGGDILNLDDVVAECRTSFAKKTDDISVQIADVQYKVDDNTRNINELSALKQIVRQSKVDGVSADSVSYTNLSVLSDGNVGSEAVSTFTENTFFRITNTWTNRYNYVLSAVVVEISDPTLLGFNNASNISFNCNYGTNNNYRNNIKQEIIDLGNNNYLLYDLSGKLINKNGEEVLPTTSYIKVNANTNVTLKIKKFYCAEVNYDGDFSIHRECLVSTALAGYVWKDILVSYKTTTDKSLSPGIAFWGSSSTEGNWIKNVAANLNMPYYWGGAGGENIWAIMGRMGVLPLRIETPITIPASALESVELPGNYELKVRWKGAYKTAKIWVSSSTSSEKLLVNPCYIAGVKGNLVGSGASNGSETLRFQRLEDGVPVTTKAYEPIYTFGFRETRDCVWFLACHFNGGQSSTEELVELYRKMYDASESKKILILGRHKVANGTVSSPSLAELQEQESALEEEFGLMFFNTREYMCRKGFARFKELYPDNYTDADVAQAAEGVTPDCMYELASNVHLNAKGYTVLTEGVTNALIQLGYNLFRLGGDINHPAY